LLGNGGVLPLPPKGPPLGQISIIESTSFGKIASILASAVKRQEAKTFKVFAPEVGPLVLSRKPFKSLCGNAQILKEFEALKRNLATRTIRPSPSMEYIIAAQKSKLDFMAGDHTFHRGDLELAITALQDKLLEFEKQHTSLLFKSSKLEDDIKDAVANKDDAKATTFNEELVAVSKGIVTLEKNTISYKAEIELLKKWISSMKGSIATTAYPVSLPEISECRFKARKGLSDKDIRELFEFCRSLSKFEIKFVDVTGFLTDTQDLRDLTTDEASSLNSDKPGEALSAYRYIANLRGPSNRKISRVAVPVKYSQTVQKTVLGTMCENCSLFMEECTCEPQLVKPIEVKHVEKRPAQIEIQIPKPKASQRAPAPTVPVKKPEPVGSELADEPGEQIKEKNTIPSSSVISFYLDGVHRKESRIYSDLYNLSQSHEVTRIECNCSVVFSTMRPFWEHAARIHLASYAELISKYPNVALPVCEFCHTRYADDRRHACLNSTGKKDFDYLYVHRVQLIKHLRTAAPMIIKDRKSGVLEEQFGIYASEGFYIPEFPSTGPANRIIFRCYSHATLRKERPHLCARLKSLMDSSMWAPEYDDLDETPWDSERKLSEILLDPKKSKVDNILPDPKPIESKKSAVKMYKVSELALVHLYDELRNGSDNLDTIWQNFHNSLEELDQDISKVSYVQAVKAKAPPKEKVPSKKNDQPQVKPTGNPPSKKKESLPPNSVQEIVVRLTKGEKGSYRWLRKALELNPEAAQADFGKSLTVKTFDTWMKNHQVPEIKTDKEKPTLVKEINDAWADFKKKNPKVKVYKNPSSRTEQQALDLRKRLWKKARTLSEEDKKKINLPQVLVKPKQSSDDEDEPKSRSKKSKSESTDSPYKTFFDAFMKGFFAQKS